MSSNVCKQYLIAVKSSFPTIGKEERKYLKNLRLIIEDYCEEVPNCTMEDLCREFGTPTNLVADFYSNANPSLLIQRINLIANIRKILFAILIAVIIIVITYSVYAYKAHKIFEQEKIFFEETIIK